MSLYKPSEREISGGRWAVVEDEDGLYHVIPTFGEYHIIGKSCWCHPLMDDPVCVHGEEIQ